MDTTTKSEFQWFVLHTRFLAQEQKVKDSIEEKRIKIEEMAEWIKEVC